MFDPNPLHIEYLESIEFKNDWTVTYWPKEHSYEVDVSHENIIIGEYFPIPSEAMSVAKHPTKSQANKLISMVKKLKQ